MQIKQTSNKFSPPVLMIAFIIVTLLVATRGDAADDSEKIVVAAGDDFVMSQKTVDAYSAFFVSQKLNWSQDEVIKTALKYELLSKEYRKKQAMHANSDDPAGNSDKVEAKILDGKKYIQGILDNWEISNVAIESYYRSNPEKYSTGKTVDGRIIVKPLDDGEKSEIRFKIIEGKKEVIVKEFVDTLISKYHIVTHNGV